MVWQAYLSVILSGRVHTELEISQRCTLSWEGPRLRSSGALSWEVGEELREELARRKCKNLNEPSTQLSEFQILFAPLTNRSHKAQNQVS